jgi:hypothetical protein
MKLKYVLWIVASIIITALDAAANQFAIEFPEDVTPGMSGFRQLIGHLSLLIVLVLAIPIIVPKSFLWFCIIAPGFDSITGHWTNLSGQWMSRWFFCLGDLLVCFLYFVFFQIACWIFRRLTANHPKRSPTN